MVEYTVNATHPDVLFVSKLCSAKTYEEVMKERTKASLDPSQRLFSAVVKGLTLNGCRVTCITARPFSINNTSRASFERAEEEAEDVRYIYPAFRISPAKRMADLYKNTLAEVRAWLSSHDPKNAVVVCDSLVAMSSIPARRLAKRKGFPTVAYVTDYPTLATSIKGKQRAVKALMQKAFDAGAARDLNKYDAYILVSEHLKELIQVKTKPATVIEDVIISDGCIYAPKASQECFTLLYGGALCERFGVNKLADTLKYIDDDRIRLLFYGSGESVPYLESIADKDKRLVYGGVLPFDELQKQQRRANLLVNPRPSDETFAKYSFPSKTLSYMLSGTPVLSTKIPGIPSEYGKYLFWFEKEDTFSMAAEIQNLSHIPSAELADRGRAAFEFARDEKNPLVQGQKIVRFLERLLASSK